MRRLCTWLTWRRVLLASGGLLAVLAFASAGRHSPPSGHASGPEGARIVLTAANRQATDNPNGRWQDGSSWPGCSPVPSS